MPTTLGDSQQGPGTTVTEVSAGTEETGAGTGSNDTEELYQVMAVVSSVMHLRPPQQQTRVHPGPPWRRGSPLDGSPNVHLCSSDF